MRRHLVTTALAATLGALLLAGAGCSTGADADADTAGPPLSADAQAACDEYTQILNQWSRDFGAVMGEIGQAEANGAEDYQDGAVESMRDLFTAASAALREQADATSDQELSESLAQASNGMAEIADQIDGYDDLAAASEMMTDGQFAEGGQKVNTICAG